MGSFKYYKKFSKSRRLGKIIPPFNKKFENVEWGEENFFLKDLFSIKRGTRLTIENREKGDRPLVTAGYENTGVAEFIGNENQEIFPENTITIDMFANTFFRNYEYSADDNILVLSEKVEISPDSKVFIVGLINKVLKEKFSYGKQFRMGSFKEIKIQLPTKNGKIDFDFMENFIAELEAEKIKNLEKYLEENNLKNYVLTAEEKQVLGDFENGKFEWGEFRLGDLFDIRKGKRLPERVLVETKGNIALINQSTLNNMVARSSGLQESNEIYKKNAITFGVNTKSFGYQKNNFYTIADVLFFKSIFLNEKIANYFIPTIKKQLPSDGWDKIFGLSQMKDLLIKVPTKNNQPDYSKMEMLISAVQKIMIKGVVEYVEEKLKE